MDKKLYDQILGAVCHNKLDELNNFTVEDILDVVDSISKISNEQRETLLKEVALHTLFIQQFTNVKQICYKRKSYNDLSSCFLDVIELEDKARKSASPDVGEIEQLKERIIKDLFGGPSEI